MAFDGCYIGFFFFFLVYFPFFLFTIRWLSWVAAVAVVLTGKYTNAHTNNKTNKPFDWRNGNEKQCVLLLHY